MPGETWTPAELALVQEWTGQGVDSATIAKRCQERGIARSQKSIMRMQERKGWHAQIPAASTPRFDKPLHIEGDALVWADVHGPFHDAEWMNRTADLALRWGVKHLVIAGDLADFNAFSVFGRQIGIDADAELATLGKIVDAACASFELWYFAGNHDVRPLRAVAQAGLSVTSIMRMFTGNARCHLSDYHWCDVTSGGKRFRVEHPKNASVLPTRVAQGLVTKYRCSVIAGHGHLWGITRDASGQDWAIDSGICADPLRIGYAQQVHSTRPAMCQGAVIIKGGVPILLGPENIAFYERLRCA